MQAVVLCFAWPCGAVTLICAVLCCAVLSRGVLCCAASQEHSTQNLHAGRGSAYRKHCEVPGLLAMGVEAALVLKRPQWMITDCDAQTCQLIVSSVNVHPHDKLAAACVV